jgi:predicted Ser/Thr protein kinase
MDQMIDADCREHSLLDHPLGLAAGGPLDTPALEPGDAIGPYRVLRQIGSGGMGVVYLAEKDGELFAVKILLWSSPDFYQRFLQEQAILSRLRHPNIARLVDSGQTGDRTPYLVMEYVDGQPIHKYCEQAGLASGARVQLFRQLCAAVIYLHQNLVVHRDLKPGNILVTADGTAKLLDFGIAKLLPGHQDAGSAAKTRAGLMTPDYASPEQVRGGTISTLTDVYALGVLLYELLSGRKPFAEPAAQVHELLRRICEDEPAKPSAASGRLELRGELDNIVLKAMQKEPPARYASVEQLDADLRSHLNGLPVLAQGNSLFYQAGKFVKRNRTGVAAAAIVIVSLFAGVVATSVQAGIARRERTRAQSQAQAAESARAFAEQERTRAETQMAEAQRERGNAERRLAQLQKAAQGAVAVYRSADPGSVPKSTKAMMAENVRNALLALRNEDTLEPRYAPLLDSVSAEVRGNRAAEASAWQVPQGWSAYQSDSGQYRVAVDRQLMFQGKPSLSVLSLVSEPSGSVVVEQEFDAQRYRGGRVRLSGYLRSASLVTQAALVLTADGGGLESPLSGAATISGTKPWQRHDVVMDIPASAGIIRMAVTLTGPGSLWAANMAFERVSPETPLTTPQRPRNLSFTSK